MTWDFSPPVGTLDKNYNLLVTRILQNPEFLNRRNKILWDYVKDENNPKDDLFFYDSAYRKFRVEMYKDRLKLYSNWHVDKTIAQYRQMIIDNFNKIKEILSKNWALVNFESGKNDSLIKPPVSIDIATKNFSSLVLREVSIPIDEPPKGNFWLYYDKNKNNVFDAGDLKTGKFSYNQSSQSLDAGAEKISLDAKRVLTNTFSIVHFPGIADIDLDFNNYKFFIVSENINDLENLKPDKTQVKLFSKDSELPAEIILGKNNINQ